MTNTKFRKKALLSSVAMLIVALIALGSATFAWYQSNPTVTSEGMKLTTNAASGLEIISASAVKTAYTSAVSDVSSTTTELGNVTYTDSTTFKNRGTALQPASFDPTHVESTKTVGRFLTATGTSAGDGTLKDGTTIEAVTSTDYILSEYVYFKIASGGTTNSGSVKLTNVTIDPFTIAEKAGDTATDQETAAAAMASALRVVIFDYNGVVVGEFGPGSAALSNYPYLSATGAYTAGTGVTYASKDYNSSFVGTKTVSASGSVSSTPVVSSVTKDPSDTQCCKIAVYLDGFDANVYSSNAIKVAGETAKMLLDSIHVEFSLTPASS